MDNALVAAYALLFVVIRSRDSLAVLIAFAASLGASLFADSVLPYHYHLINVAIYAMLAIYVSPCVKPFALLIVAFQYVMAWDSYLFFNYETILYHVYVYMSFTLNLLLIFSITKARSEKIGSSYHPPSGWLSDLWLVATHKTRMRKG